MPPSLPKMVVKEAFQQFYHGAPISTDALTAIMEGCADAGLLRTLVLLSESFVAGRGNSFHRRPQTWEPLLATRVARR